MPDPSSAAEVRDLLASCRHIAVLGAHSTRERPAFYVPDYMHAQGYEIYPVNPGGVGQTWWGRPVVATLAELKTPIDVVDVFRRADQLPAHLDDLLDMDPLPKVVWLQLGIRHDEIAAQLRDLGIRVIQDRCMLADHRLLGMGAFC